MREEMKLEELKNKKVAILGLGIEGLALASFLDGKVRSLALLDGATEEELLQKTTNNKNLKALLEKNYDKVFGDKYLDSLEKYDLVFRSPGIKILEQKIQEAISKSVEVSSQIKLFFDLCPAKIIGVTGTKGKGTTASLIFEILKNNFQNSNTKNQTNPKSQTINQKPEVSLAGNIGKPAITLLNKTKDSDWVILELSSFQLQDLKKSPHIAVITNVAVDHLDYHKDEVEYVTAKESIAKHQNKDDVVIANKDYDNAIIISTLSKGKQLYFSGKSECDGFVKNDTAFVMIDGAAEKICDTSEIKLVGKHNLENIVAATLACIVVGIDLESIRKSAKKFNGLPHRLELVGEIDDKRFYNDSFATNPEPTIAAIRSFKEPITIILGGSSKGADFSDLAKKITNSSVNNIILIGDEALKIKTALQKSNYQKGIYEVDGEMQDFVSKADEISKKGDVILLSPACASFGIFNNYKERGNKFIEAVKNLN